jgi:formyl-CoA transferase
MGTLAALHYRERSGTGQVVDAAIYESVLSMMECLVTEFDQLGHVRERSGPILPRIAPSNVYPTRDGIVMIGANQDTVFARLCETMGAPQLASDDRYRDHQARGAHQHELDETIARWTATLGTRELLALLEQAGSIRTPAPQLGQHNEEIYGELLGLNAETLGALRGRAVI